MAYSVLLSTPCAASLNMILGQLLSMPKTSRRALHSVMDAFGRLRSPEKKKKNSNATVPSVPSFEYSAPARRTGASGVREGCFGGPACSSEQRGSTSPLTVRPPPPLRNIGRNRSSSLLPPKYASCHASHSVADACGRPQLDECREPSAGTPNFSRPGAPRASRVLR